MLNKIILLNSAGYQKANITLNAESIQIVGKNNIGKTTLIGALNFLYIKNMNDWNFTKSAKESLHYYFKSFDKNYIIFEIFKKSYFCILLRRNESNNIEYYKIDSSFDDIEDKIINNESTPKTIFLLEDIVTSLITKIKLVSDKEINSLIYGDSKRSQSVLWLKKDISPTVFIKIYKNLLNPNLITNEVFKNSLLVADNKQKKKVEFLNDGNNAIENMQRIKKDIDKLKNIKINFKEFKELVNKYQMRELKQIENLQYFLFMYDNKISEFDSRYGSLAQEIVKIKNEKIKPTKKERDNIIGQLGKNEILLKQQQEQIIEKKLTIEKINKYEPIDLLKISLFNLEDQESKLNYSLTKIKEEKYTLENINRLISNKEKELKVLKEKIENFDNLLIHHLSNDNNSTNLLNNILSGDILDFDKSKVIKKVSKINLESLTIFDGLIDISSLKPKEIITIQSLETKLKRIKNELKSYEEIKVNIETKQEKEKKLKDLKILIDKIKTQIKAIEELASLEETLEQLEEIYKDDSKENNQLKSKEKDLEELISKLEEDIKNIEEEQKGIESSKSELNLYRNNFNEDIEEFNVIKSSNSPMISLDELIEDIKNLQQELKKLKNEKDNSFNNLKYILYKEQSDEQDFIKEVDEDLDAIPDKEKTVEELIETITNQVKVPVNDLLENLTAFERYIGSLNTEFKKYRISNLKSVEIKITKSDQINKDLNTIAKINKEDLFEQQDHTKKVEILKTYINQSKTVKLFDLFEVIFIVDGVERNLKDEIESNGTDIMIKTTLFMLIIKELIIEDMENKLVIYLDELSAIDDDNLKVFINRCIENNFIPVFASPDKKTHIEKYYDLVVSSSSGKKAVDERRATYARDRV